LKTGLGVRGATQYSFVHQVDPVQKCRKRGGAIARSSFHHGRNVGIKKKKKREVVLRGKPGGKPAYLQNSSFRRVLQGRSTSEVRWGAEQQGDILTS